MSQKHLDRTAVYSAARRDATHYPHRAHFPTLVVRSGDRLRHLRNIASPGKLMFRYRFSIGIPRFVRPARQNARSAVPGRAVMRQTPISQLRHAPGAGVEIARRAAKW